MRMTLSSVRPKSWTRVEYERLVDLGVFQPGERLEPVGGALVIGEPQGGPHATAVGLTEDALREAFDAGWTVRAQSPIAFDEDSEPEPDIAVVPSLPLDRPEKASLYARARIADYWIVNLADRILEVYREPVADPDAPYGWRYRSTATLHAGDGVTPLAGSRSTVPVSDLLP